MNWGIGKALISSDFEKRIMLISLALPSAQLPSAAAQLSDDVCWAELNSLPQWIVCLRDCPTVHKSILEALYQNILEFDRWLPECTRVYLSVPDWTWVYQSLPEFSIVYLVVPEYTWVYQSLPEFTRVYQNVPECNNKSVLQCTREYKGVLECTRENKILA